MPKKLDPAIATVLSEYGFDHSACWDCHGTWVVYHWALERIAAKAAIIFNQPHIIEADGANGIAAMCVTGNMGEASEWSVGEASPKNNKNAYCWAMAEKRAKDRVILKLIGLHGLVFSEEEADEFKKKESRPLTSGQHNKTAARKLMGGLAELIHNDTETPDEQMLDAHLNDHADLLEQVRRDWPDWLEGIEGNQDFIGFDQRVIERRVVLQERSAMQGA